MVTSVEWQKFTTKSSQISSRLGICPAPKRVKFTLSFSLCNLNIRTNPNRRSVSNNSILWTESYSINVHDKQQADVRLNFQFFELIHILNKQKHYRFRSTWAWRTWRTRTNRSTRTTRRKGSTRETRKTGNFLNCCRIYKFRN